MGMVTPIVGSRYALHLVITNDRSNSWIISAVYNSNSIHRQRFLWNELSGLAYLNLPWLIMGDFNAMVSQDEHRGGSNYYYSRKASVFSEFIAANNLLYVNYVGSPFTWCNNQLGLARRWARLDCCLVNMWWANSIDSCVIKHLPRLHSDHSPLLLSIYPRNSFVKKRIFRFDNFWLEHVGCHEAVRKAWNFLPHSNPMQAFSHLISRTRHLLLEWKANGLHPLDSAIEKLESSILEEEGKDELGDISDLSPNSLTSMYNNLSALHRQNNVKWAQRARLMWVHNGENNSSFFFNTICFRTHYNSISNIMDFNGNIFTDHPNISRTFVRHFSDLWLDPSNDQFQEILNDLPNELPQISFCEGEELIRDVTKKRGI